MITKYRAVPSEIEAIQYLGNNGSEIELWLGFHLISMVNTVFRPNGNLPQDYKITVPGIGTACHGDYITKSSTGLVQIIGATAFEQTYKQVDA